MITRQSDGEKPTYEELELAYLKERKQREALEEAFKQANQALAKLRFELKKLS